MRKRNLHHHSSATTSDDAVVVASPVPLHATAAAAAAHPFKPSFSNQLKALTKKNFIVFLRKPILLASAILLPFLAFIVVGAIQAALASQDDNTPQIKALFDISHPAKLPTSSVYLFFQPSNERNSEIMRRVAVMNNLKYGVDVKPAANNRELSTLLVDNGATLLNAEWWTVINFNVNAQSNGPNSQNNNRSLSYSIMDGTASGSSSTGSLFESRDLKNPKLHVYPQATQLAIDAAILSYARDPSPSADLSRDGLSLTYDFFKGQGTTEVDYFDLGYLSRAPSSFGSSSNGGLAEFTGSFDLGILLLKPILAVSFIPMMVLVLDVVSKEKQRKLIGALRRMGLMDSVFWISLLIPVSVISLVASFAGAAGAKIMASSSSIFNLTSFEVIVILNFSYSLALAGMGVAFASVVSRLFSSIAAAIVINFAFFIPTDVYPFAATWFDSCREVYAKALLYLFAPFYNYGKAPSTTTPSTPSPLPNSSIQLESATSPPPATPSPAQSAKKLLAYETTVDTPFITTLHLATSIFVFALIAWYLNQAVPSVEGFSRPWYFPFAASYWTGRQKRKEAIAVGDTLAMEKEKSGKTGECEDCEIVETKGKVYALLGHNGAGKTTLINMLQWSLLPHLHLKFFIGFRGEFKGSPKQLDAYIMETLEKVGLEEAAHRRAGKYSGGMKRRLSLALATVSPSAKIIFLDEPTTVWKVIQDLKQNRVVVLTTHSMEEADELGDHISIMHQGRLRAAGSSLFLKNRFGKGYQLTVVNRVKDESKFSEAPTSEPSARDHGKAQETTLLRSAMEQYVNYALPGSEIVSSAAGAITVAVFLKLCTENKAIVAETESPDGITETSTKSRLCILCASRPSEIVTLYTKSGLAVTIPYFVCTRCADGQTSQPIHQDVLGVTETTLLSFEGFVANLPEQYQNALRAAAVKEDRERLEKREVGGVGVVSGGALLGRQLIWLARLSMYTNPNFADGSASKFFAPLIQGDADTCTTFVFTGFGRSSCLARDLENVLNSNNFAAIVPDIGGNGYNRGFEVYPERLLKRFFQGPTPKHPSRVTRGFRLEVTCDHGVWGCGAESVDGEEDESTGACAKVFPDGLRCCLPIGEFTEGRSFVAMYTTDTSGLRGGDCAAVVPVSSGNSMSMKIGATFTSKLKPDFPPPRNGIMYPVWLPSSSKKSFSLERFDIKGRVCTGFRNLVALDSCGVFGDVFGSVVTKTVSAGMVSYLLHIGSAIAAPFFVAIADDVGVIPVWYGLFPPIGVTSVFNILMLKKNQSAALIPGLVVLFGSIALGLLGCYIHAIRPSPVGIPVHPLLGLEKLGSHKKSTNHHDDINDIEGSADHIDDDVAAEKRAVTMAYGTGVMDPREAVRIVHLRKQFPNKLAVDDISLSIKYGETFGLLGPNGAGKTTTLSMITGLLERTSGYGCREIGEGWKNSLWRVVGVTPQFDTVWPELTVEEHLTFYCRLRGVAKKGLAGMVRRIAEDIELDGDAFRTKASGLSGGMRRRLSIGISLTADPKILVLDEPTTGLDAEAKRQVWKIIDGIRRGGVIDVLSSRHILWRKLTLFAQELVLGSQLHLKKKFGNGLKLTMRFPIDSTFIPSSYTDIVQLSYLEQKQSIRVKEVSNAIQHTLLSSSRDLHHTLLNMSITSSDIHVAHANASSGEPGVPQDVSWMVTLTWVLPRASIDVAEVFLALEEACVRQGIADWALTETTLEDVFVKVVEG
ncbi:hypothetical protein BC829DRAFT_412570 [Chytridium lagenaria]|nr:hypothetical protein BC829DRAFT_412570 [Chytridium lagenaria]